MKNVKRFAGAAGVLLIAGVVAMFSFSAAASKPENLGAVDGKLAPCPGSPNCVSTQAADPKFRIEPIPFQGSGEAALTAIRSILEKMPRCRVITCGDGYLHAEFSSRLFGFVDDVEFLVDEENRQLQFRSASRVGYSDLGVNRRRMEQIRAEFSQRTAT